MDTYFITMVDGERIVNTFDYDISMNEFFNRVSKVIAFSDCSDEEVVEIVFDDEHFVYVGWQPGMVYEYSGNAGNSWEGCFPEWDH